MITTHHLHVIVDYAKYGIRESGVLFHVVEPPEHGSLDVSVWLTNQDNIFTLLDLNTDKVKAKPDFLKFQMKLFYAFLNNIKGRIYIFQVNIFETIFN